MNALGPVTIVGGGIAGLVLARRLAIGGREVRLLEASDRLGGTVAKHTVGGLDLDAGAESFAVRGGTVAALAESLDLEVVVPAGDGAWLQPVDSAAVPLPSTSLLGIPGTPLANDVVRVIGRRDAWRAQLDSLIPAVWERPALTLGELVRRRMGDGVVNKLVAPVVHGVHSMHPDELPLERAHPGLRKALARTGSLAGAVRSLRAAAPAGSAVAGIRGGMYRLPEALAASLDRMGVTVELGYRVDDVASLDGIVVVAASGVLSPVGGRTVVLATLVVDAPELDANPRGTGLLVASGAPGVSARALTHATAKWPWLREAADGRHVLRLSYDVEPRDLADTARRDAEALLGVRLPAGSVVDFARVEWTRPGAAAASGAAPSAVVPGGAPVLIGETIAGSGLAGIIAHANAQADILLAD